MSLDPEISLKKKKNNIPDTITTFTCLQISNPNYTIEEK